MRQIKVYYSILVCLIVSMGCELENKPVEIISITASDANAIPGEIIILSCKAEDEDGDKLIYKWSSFSGSLSVNSDSAEWTAPNKKGYYDVVCKVSDGYGSSAAAIITIGVCDYQTIDMSNINIDEWNFEGSANWDFTNKVLELTPAQTGLVGTAFNTVDTVSGYQVEIGFDFYIGDGSGADGLTLTALDVDRMTTFLGESGQGLGYGGLPGWTIEIDTYYNGVNADSTSDDHLMFTFDGVLSNKVLWAALPEMEDTGWHFMDVKVDAPHVYVAVDSIVYFDSDIDGWNEFNAVVGFTAGTGGATNRHLVRGLIISEKGDCE